jgi:hypothetical protein
MNQKNQKEGGGEGGWGRSPDGVVRIVYFGETKKEHKRKCDAKDFGFCIDFGADCPNMPNETKKEECTCGFPMMTHKIGCNYGTKTIDTIINSSPHIPTGEDLINTVNNFIKKWCGENASHLLDSDDNDGEKLRQLQRKQWKDEMVEEIKSVSLSFPSCAPCKKWKEAISDYKNYSSLIK